MAQRVGRVVGQGPRRRIGFGSVVAALVAAIVLSVAGVFTAAPSAKTDHSRPQSQGRLTPQQQWVSNQVNSLLRRMTVGEKFGQLEMSGPQGPNGTAGPTLLADAKNGLVGSILDMVGVANINELQRAALQSRLHIPLIFSLDVIHGYKTMYPISLGESSSWDPALATSDASMAASEGAADGIKWTFSPMVDVTRDPRWGRVQGTSGEDPFLGAAIGSRRASTATRARTTAPRTRWPPPSSTSPPTAPRSPAVNTTRSTCRPSSCSTTTCRPYKAGVDAGVATVMSSFNSLNGVPATADPYTLQTILRDEWGFGGTVVSDYQAVQELEEFGYAANDAQAAQQALTAGVDIEMAVQLPSPNSTYANAGPQLLAQHKITMAQLNNSVRHVLTLKYLAGHVRPPLHRPEPGHDRRADPGQPDARLGPPADESMVLLNNQNNALPLSTCTPSIAVVGPLADDALDQLGPDVPIGYDTTPADLKHGRQDRHRSWTGSRRRLPHANVTYAAGM